MSLLNVSREKINVSGKISWNLIDSNGLPIPTFRQYCIHIRELALASQIRYVIVISRFIDYLYEVSILGESSVTRGSINLAIDDYLALLEHGQGISLAIDSKKQIYADGDKDREKLLKHVAKRLQIRSLASGSWPNTLAALNSFLKFCALLQQEALEMAVVLGKIDPIFARDAEWDFRPLILAIEKTNSIGSLQIQYIKQATMLGGVIRFRGENLKRAKGLRRSTRSQERDIDSLKFPEEHFPDLLIAATSWRDRAMWTLGYASGLRRSEILNLQWRDIDFIERTVFALDPNNRRFGTGMDTRETRQRFKGRTVSWTYLRPPYREWFFVFLQKYKQEEYRLPIDSNDFVFQYLIYPHFGRPLVEATDESLISAFKSAVVRAKIPGPPTEPNHIWLPHSLRHGFADYMLNEYQIPDRSEKGVTEAELQLLLGHKLAQTTMRYARKRTTDLKKKLRSHDTEFIDASIR